MATDEAVGQAQLAAKCADLVLEQLPQGFDQFQAHLFGQAAYVVVRFDGDRRTAREGNGFDYIRVERALGKELGPVDGIGMFLEHINEQLADDLAFGLGVGLAFEFTQKQFTFIGMDQLNIIIVAEHAHDLLRLVLTQQPVIDKDAGQLITDGFMNQDRCDRAVDTAGQAANYLFIPDLFTDLFDHLFAIGSHGPVALEPGQFHEILIEFRAFGGVMHFGVELHRIEMTACIGSDRIRRVG